MRVLQIGKFYPISGGVEKVMYDITMGLSQKQVYCDAAVRFGREARPGESFIE